MHNSDFQPSDLTKEKRLWDVYRASRRIPHSRFNAISTILVFVVLAASALYQPQSTKELLSLVRHSSDTCLGVSLSTLGFLIAGFTIFATISQPELSLRMAEVCHPESGLSYLKHNYFIFIRVFIYYIAFAVLCLLIVALGGPGGIVSYLVSKFVCHEQLRDAIVRITYVALFTGYFFLLVQLKSFVFNIYHAVMTALRWKAERYD